MNKIFIPTNKPEDWKSLFQVVSGPRPDTIQPSGVAPDATN